jgi:hypothetical protein
VNRNRLSKLIETALENPYSVFVFVMNAAHIRGKYITRLDRFFHLINIQGNTIEERCRYFAEIAKKDNKWVLNTCAYSKIANSEGYDRKKRN